ncbi:MAG: amidase family protein [Thermomicrobiales bacterium]
MADIVIPRLAQVSRRDLIAGSAIVGAGAAALTVGVAANSGGDHGNQRVQFAADTTSEPTEGVTPTEAPADPATPTSVVERADPIDPATILETASISEMLDGMETGAFTAVQLMQAVLDRIELYDRRGPKLGAVIETVPDAMERAQAADDARAAGEPLGLLHGIPVLVKDIIATNDDTHTTAGSFALEDNVVVRDAFLVEQLRNAGAIVLGKSNLTEWSNFKGDGGAAGFSPRGGQSRNPYDPSLSPSGSSSGSAISVAAGYVPAAIGSETNGSIISPAAYCGVVGLKPTTGLVSRSGVIPISLSADSPGPMTRSVEDAAIMLSVLAGFDPEDVLNAELADYAPAARFDESPIPEPGTADYRAALDPDALNGARIGVYRRLFGFSAEGDALVEELLELMADEGAEIVEDISAGPLDELDAFDRYSMYLAEMSTGFISFCETYTPDGPTLNMADVVAYNIEHPDLELVYSDQWALEDVANTSLTLDNPDYLALLETHNQLARQDGLDAIMDEAEVDVLIAPSAGLPSVISQTGEEYSGSSSGFAAYAGYPSLTIPIGDVDGLPVGINFFGRAFSEATLLAIANAVEKLAPKRTPPQL